MLMQVLMLSRILALRFASRALKRFRSSLALHVWDNYPKIHPIVTSGFQFLYQDPYIQLNAWDYIHPFYNVPPPGFRLMIGVPLFPILAE